jgi:hypothetical protein
LGLSQPAAGYIIPGFSLTTRRMLSRCATSSSMVLVRSTSSIDAALQRRNAPQTLRSGRIGSRRFPWPFTGPLMLVHALGCTRSGRPVVTPADHSTSEFKVILPGSFSVTRNHLRFEQAGFAHLCNLGCPRRDQAHEAARSLLITMYFQNLMLTTRFYV